MQSKVVMLAWVAPAFLGVSLALGADAFTGSVKDSGGKALPGVFVSAQRGGATYTTTVYSDDTGKFRFPELVAGAYTVTAHAG